METDHSPRVGEPLGSHTVYPGLIGALKTRLTWPVVKIN